MVSILIHPRVIMLFLQLNCISFTKPQKRWRIAVFTVHIALSISKQSHFKASKSDSIDVAFPAHNPHIVLDIDPAHDANHGKLIEIVRNKNLSELKSYGGTPAVTELHPKGITSLFLQLNGISFTKPQERWRIAVFTVYIALYISKQSHFKASKSESIDVASPAHNPHIVLDIDPAHDANHGKLIEIVRNKNLSELQSYGGTPAVTELLRTNLQKGVYGDQEDLRRRKAKFGSNTYPKPKPEGIIHFVLEAFWDATILILLVCATLSLAFGIAEHGAREGWYEGGSIFLAVFLVVVVSAASNFRQDRQFDKLSKISDEIRIEVIRNNVRKKVSIYDVVVGDIVVLKIGDQVPTDGLFIDGHSLQVDESSMTGESDHMEVNSSLNPFLLSGSKIVDGYARMVVVSVGMDTAWGQMMSSISRKSVEQTPLQERLSKLTSFIRKVGLTVAFAVFIVMMIRYFNRNTRHRNGDMEFNGVHRGFRDVFSSVLRIVSVTLIAIPEALPLAVTLTLTYSMKRMMADQAMVRKLSACETMGSATVICTDKTGTITINEMKVAKFFTGLEEILQSSYKIISQDLVELLHKGIALNTTGSAHKLKPESPVEYFGSPTEKAVLSWGVENLVIDMDGVKQQHTILQVETFNSEKKQSGVLIRNNVDNSVHVHWKGAAEMILSSCSYFFEPTGEIKIMTDEKKSQLENIIQGMAATSLRCIAFAYKKIEYEECNTSENGEGKAPRMDHEDLTLLGIVGMKDPCRPNARKAIKACKDAGVAIKMVTGDNVFTAKAIAIECGILENDKQVIPGEVIEGIEFSNYTDEERMLKINDIRVLARSSPLDKLLMVQCLKKAGQVVAVTGDGTNDVPALKEADVGLSMGIQGTELAKESSDIIILDDDFSTVATVLRWGRCVYNNIQKFIQFQLTVNVAALVINFIAAVSSGKEPLTAVQLLWVNLIMDTLGALALATEHPTNELMHNPPVGKTAPLITNTMWRNILTQVFYQIAILLILHFSGRRIFEVNQQVNNTLIFNTFVLCQIFNEFNSRSIEKHNVFKGIHKNKLFLSIIVITVILQIMMVEFLANFANTVRLNIVQWCICVGIAAFTWPLGWAVKYIPVRNS